MIFSDTSPKCEKSLLYIPKSNKIKPKSSRNASKKQRLIRRVPSYKLIGQKITNVSPRMKHKQHISVKTRCRSSQQLCGCSYGCSKLFKSPWNELSCSFVDVRWWEKVAKRQHWLKKNHFSVQKAQRYFQKPLFPRSEWSYQDRENFTVVVNKNNILYLVPEFKTKLNVDSTKKWRNKTIKQSIKEILSSKIDGCVAEVA